MCRIWGGTSGQAETLAEVKENTARKRWDIGSSRALRTWEGYQKALVAKLGTWRSSTKARWIAGPISVERCRLCQGKHSDLTDLASPQDMNLCNVKLEGPFGKGDKSEQMVEKCAWDVKTHCLCREVSRKRKTERGEKTKTTHPHLAATHIPGSDTS